MKAPMDKHYDDLAKKIVVSAAIDQPSDDFTQNLMAKIETLPQKASFKYKPVIAKPVLYGLVIGFIALVLYRRTGG